MKTIGLDLDGVICGFQPAFIKACGGDPDDWKKWTGWEFEFCPVAIPLDERLKIWERIKIDEKFWRDIEPMHGSSIARVAEVSRQHSVYCVTHRPRETFAATAEWLQRYEIIPIGLLFVKDKRRACSGLRIEAFLDDSPDVVDEFDGYKMQAYILDRPWNREVNGHRRVTSVGEFLDKVLKG